MEGKDEGTRRRKGQRAAPRAARGHRRCRQERRAGLTCAAHRRGPEAGGREGQRGIPEGPNPAHFFASQDSSGSAVFSGRNVRGRLMPTSSNFARIMFTASGTEVLSVLTCTSAFSGAS